MSVRSWLADSLTEDWADIPELAGIRVVATERGLDDIQQTTALIRLRSIGRAPSTPLSHRNVGLVLTLISPHLDLDLAADELDDITPEVLDYLDTRHLHEDATTVVYGERLAFDIPLTLLASKE
jgi:hypothetical protein